MRRHTTRAGRLITSSLARSRRAAANGARRLRVLCAVVMERVLRGLHHTRRAHLEQRPPSPLPARAQSPIAGPVPAGPWRWPPRTNAELQHSANADPNREALVAADGTTVLRVERSHARSGVHPGARDLLADAWELPHLRHQIAEARAWAWAEYHQDWYLLVTDPYAEAGPAAAPEWLRSNQPPWPAPEPARQEPQ